MSSADDRQDPLRNSEDGSESTGRDPWSAPPDPTTGFGQGGYDQTAPAGLPQPQGYGPPAPYGSSPHDQGTPAAFGYGPGAYGQAGYGPGAYDGPLGSGQGHPPLRPTNGMAIASLVLGIVGIFFFGSTLALIFGYIARKQIAERGEAGGGMALAGIILGWIGVGFLVVFLLVGAISGAAGSVS